LGTQLNPFGIIIKILGGAHHAEMLPLLPTGAINFLVGSKILSPAGALANFARAFARVPRAGVGGSFRTGFGLRASINFLETLTQRAAPAATLHGPFLSFVDSWFYGRSPDFNLLANYSLNHVISLSAKDVVVVFSHCFKLPKQSAHPREEL
jgi:hypothetical protein